MNNHDSIQGLSVFSDEHFMKEAFKQAEIAMSEGEIPVGAVITLNNRIIARGYNQTEKLNDFTAHAEMIAFTSASEFLGSKYLDKCTLYVTLEPCVMCAGASFWTRIGKIVYGASDLSRGYSRLQEKVLHPKTQVKSGVIQTQCEIILEEFFKNKRNSTLS